MATAHIPTGVEIDGILIDANRISRRVFVALTEAIGKATAEDNAILRDELTGDLIAAIVIHWPFDKPVSKDSYLDLGLLDSRRVDQAITEFMAGLSEKKSESPLTPPASSNGSLAATPTS